jgi:hypothetical protein
MPNIKAPKSSTIKRDDFFNVFLKKCIGFEINVLETIKTPNDSTSLAL